MLYWVQDGLAVANEMSASCRVNKQPQVLGVAPSLDFPTHLLEPQRIAKTMTNALCLYRHVATRFLSLNWEFMVQSCFATCFFIVSRA